MDYVIGFLVACGLYRMYKWWSRRCECGSLWYWRFHRIYIEDPVSRKCSVFAFKEGLRCGHFEGRSYDKQFSFVGFWWRRIFLFWQFWDASHHLRRAGLVSERISKRRSVIWIECHTNLPAIPRGPTIPHRALLRKEVFRLRHLPRLIPKDPIPKKRPGTS